MNVGCSTFGFHIDGNLIMQWIDVAKNKVAWTYGLHTYLINPFTYQIVWYWIFAYSVIE